MNDAIRAAQQASHPATMRLPAAFEFPLGGIVARTAIGLVLLAAVCLMLVQAGMLWLVGGICLGLLGLLVTASNLRALIDPERRKIVLDEHWVEIRYGISRRRYRFVDYSDYRIARLGFRRFLTALPIETERSLGERAEQVRVTLYDRPAFLTPMPLLGGDAPASLLEWQQTLNELRRVALTAAGLAGASERTAESLSADEARRAAMWHAREQAGAKPSRLSRRAYVAARAILVVVFLVLLFAPIGLAALFQQAGLPACDPANGSMCASRVMQALSIGGPVLSILAYVLVGGWMMVRRAHDLDLDLPFWRAVIGTLSFRGLQFRLGNEEGIAGTNRFGPRPPA
ncbi:MAG: hypothetical protein R3D05_14065 [Dongiaceae bacterium]